MCGRFGIDLQTLDDWASFRGRLTAFTPVTNYDVRPTTNVPAVFVQDDKLQIDALRWGLVPFFSKGVAGPYATFNATIEKLKAGPSWRGPWKRSQRCIMPATGFFEWKLEEDGSTGKYWIRCRDQLAMGFAGIWDRSIKDDGTFVDSCSIVTMPANALMAEIHNSKTAGKKRTLRDPSDRRMPAILPQADHEAWLHGSPDEAFELLKPYPDQAMEAWRVRNDVRANDASVIERLA